MMDNSEQFRKLFIGGLHLQTTDQSLKEFYERWGEVVDCIVMKDPNTRRSRGFGFITYSDMSMVDACLAERPHIIDGKQVDPKRAMPREESNKPEAHLSIKKVFVGGIKDQIGEDDLRNHFAQYGNVESVEMVTDKDTGKKRGFAFLTFDDTDSVDKIVLIKSHSINGIQVEVKKAMERDQRGGGGGSGGRGGRGGRGGERGGRGRGGGYADRAGGYGGGYGGGMGGGYGGDGGYGGGYGGDYNSGYGGAGGWGQNGSGAGGWNQGSQGYGNGYGAGAGGGGNFGSGYGGGYGGGVMKSSGYTQRATGPYGGGGYGSGAGGYGGAGYGGAGYGGQR